MPKPRADRACVPLLRLAVLDHHGLALADDLVLAKAEARVPAPAVAGTVERCDAFLADVGWLDGDLGSGSLRFPAKGGAIVNYPFIFSNG